MNQTSSWPGRGFSGQMFKLWYISEHRRSLVKTNMSSLVWMRRSTQSIAQFAGIASYRTASLYNLYIRTAKVRFAFTALFHSRSPQKVVFLRVVPWGTLFRSKFATEMVMRIVLSSCKNSSTDICSHRKLWLRICKWCCATGWWPRKLGFSPRSS